LPAEKHAELAKEFVSPKQQQFEKHHLSNIKSQATTIGTFAQKKCKNSMSCQGR